MFAIKYVYEYEKFKNLKKIRRISWKKKKKRSLYKFVTSNQYKKGSLYNQYITKNLGENLIMINKIKY